MRSAWLAVGFATACGRVSFDPSLDGARGGDGRGGDGAGSSDLGDAVTSGNVSGGTAELDAIEF